MPSSPPEVEHLEPGKSVSVELGGEFPQQVAVQVQLGEVGEGGEFGYPCDLVRGRRWRRRRGEE